MPSTRLKCLLAMLMLSVIGFGPLSLTCLIGFYVVLARPDWFLGVTRRLYRGTPARDPAGAARPAPHAALVRTETLLVLVILLILDIAPVPVTGTIGLYVVLFRPAWFAARVKAIYASDR